MGYFDILNKGLEDYLFINYKEDEQIQALLDSYQEWEEPKQELFEAIDREILYEFIEAKSWYTEVFDEEEFEELISEDYINYFMDVSIQEVYNYFEEVDIKTVLWQTDLYEYKDMYYLIWDI